MDDEKMLWNGPMGYKHEDGRVEIIHVRAKEYLRMGDGVAMVGIEIFYGKPDDKQNQEVQRVDVTKEHYKEHGLAIVVCRAFEARKKIMEEEKKQ